MGEKLSEAQRKALKQLAVGASTPSDIGYAMTDGLKKGGYPMKAQGLGRIGGGMAARLIKLGLVFSSSRRGGFPCYEISSAGRRALTEAER